MSQDEPTHRSGSPFVVQFGAERTGDDQQGIRPGSLRVRWLVVLGAMLALAVAIVLVTAGDGGAGFNAQAQSICARTQQTLKRVRTTPTSISEGLQIEHTALATYQREMAELGALHPPPSDAGAFQAGLADDRTLVGMFSSVLARPDFVELSLTLPGHPTLVPPWLKSWLARSHALIADAHTQFSRLPGLGACEASLS
jgi:hypothetical protein